MIYTIGHSTRSIEEFNNILQAYEIKLLVDVRTIPPSRYNPLCVVEIPEQSDNKRVGQSNLLGALLVLFLDLGMPQS